MPPYYRILLAGDTGTGKTTQLETMPRPHYAHVFDPSAHTTLQLDTSEFVNFFPEAGDLDMLPRTALKGGRRHSDGVASARGPQVYIRWVETINKQIAEGHFEKVGTFLLDSATMLGLHLMERQRWLGDKHGREDERQDHKLAGETMNSALWTVFNLPCHVLVTMHTKYAEVKVGDTKTGELKNKFTVPGGSQLTLPRFTSACWYTQVLEDKARGPRYVALTRPQNRWPHVRTPRAWSGLPLWHDLTIEDRSRPQEYGIGKLIG